MKARGDTTGPPDRANATGSLGYATSRPAGALRALISHYAGYRVRDVEPGTQRGLPSRHVTLIVSLDAPIRILSMPDGHQPGGAFRAFVAGLHESAAVIEKRRHQAGLHLFLSPLGVRALLGVPARALSARVVALDDVLGPTATELHDRLLSAGSWKEQFDILDAVLLRRIRESPQTSPVLSWAWRRIAASNGNLSIAALARDIGWSRRRLHDRFHSTLGVGPKTLARVFRFEHAARLLKRAEFPLAEIALACGFSDQGHLNREWKRFARCTPGEWVREERPFVQDYELGDWDH